jgi:hypothetical protein
MIGLEMGQSATVFEHDRWAGGTACPTNTCAPNCHRVSWKCRKPSPPPPWSIVFPKAAD